MKKMISKNVARYRRRRRVRAKVSGTAVRPRFSVFRSLRGVSVQLIDDATGKTVVSAVWKEVKKESAKNDVARAAALGKLVAKRCAQKNISSVVFDRGGYAYHGKVKAVADGARAGGLIL